MPSTFTSPFATSFITGCKNGTPCSIVVNNIAKRTGKNIQTIVKSLCNVGLCECVKFNGTWVYWPTFKTTTNASNANTCQTNMWQNFVEWCITSNCCTPTQLVKNCTSQKTLMTYCKNFFGKQFTGTFSKTKKTTKTKRTGKKSWASSKSRWNTGYNTKRRTTTTKRHRKTTSNNNTWSRTYKFPTFKTRTVSRRYVRAA